MSAILRNMSIVAWATPDIASAEVIAAIAANLFNARRLFMMSVAFA